MINGIVFVCGEDLKLNQYIYNSFNDIEPIAEGEFFGKMCDSQEKTKVEAFSKQLISDGVIFNWELNVVFKNLLKPLKFSGSKVDNNYFIFALETNSDVPFLYEELMRINNDQSNYIRSIIKDKFMITSDDTDQNDALDELTKLNNELANLQRELSKKNIELQRLNELKNHFLGMAAHDLRNPLSHLYNFSELLEEFGDNLNDKQKHFISIIKKQSLFMVNLVNDLLDFSAIESGKVTLNLQPIDIYELIDQNIQLNRNIADNKHISIQFHKPDLPIVLILDPEKINQVISNLITNAIKYSNKDTIINVEVEDRYDEVVICVKDQGLGISKDETNNLFQPFQKTKNKSTGGEKSTGLGLFITKRIVESHKGRIWVDSELNVGSTFCFTISKNLSYHP